MSWTKYLSWANISKKAKTSPKGLVEQKSELSKKKGWFELSKKDELSKSVLKGRKWAKIRKKAELSKNVLKGLVEQKIKS